MIRVVHPGSRIRIRNTAITYSYIDFRVDSNTCTIGNPMPKYTLSLYQSRLHPPARDYEFGIRKTFFKGTLREKKLFISYFCGNRFQTY
jgi:hypothetical protein